MPRTSSRSSNQSARIVRAWWSGTSYPACSRVRRDRGSMSSPTCQPLVPALSTTTAWSKPASRNRSVSTTSAIGERQMLPRHTTQIRYGCPGADGSLGGRSLIPPKDARPVPLALVLALVLALATVAIARSLGLVVAQDAVDPGARLVEHVDHAAHLSFAGGLSGLEDRTGQVHAGLADVVPRRVAGHVLELLPRSPLGLLDLGATGVG